MANSYWTSYLREFVPPEAPRKDTYFCKYKAEWNKAVKRLKESGYDLSKIMLVEKTK